MSLSGGGVDGHVQAEGVELAEVAADIAVAAGLLVVPAGARSVNLAAGSARRGQMMIRIERPTAHMALVAPRRRVSRRSRSPRKV